MLASDTVVEVQDTTARENYNKVVIHKRKCVPYVALTNNHSGLRVSSAGNNNRPIVPPKPRPKVPPKPVLGDGDIPRKELNCLPGLRDSFNNKGNIIEEAKEELIKNICNSREQILRAEREELLGRMSRAVRLLKEDKLDVQRELTDNDTALTNLVHTVRMTGNLVDADKLKVHIDELDSITSLMTVLRVRLKSNQNKAEVTRDPREKENLGSKIAKLRAQLEEAESLKSFRNRRGELIFGALSSYLDEVSLSMLRRLLEEKVSLRAELCQVEEQIQIAEYQISALQNT